MSLFEPLEPRILLSADIIPLPADTEAPDIQIPEEDLTLEGVHPDQTASEAADTAVNADDSQQSDLPSEETSSIPAAATETAAEESAAEEIIFINDDIEGVTELAAGLEESTGSTVIILDSARDGITQVSAALENTTTSSIHLFTHGTEGNVKIGSTWINQSTIGEYQDSISSWGDSLTEDGDILFYGCDLAATPDGEALIDEIAELTGADVAASTDTTGSPVKGGDWILEYQTGAIETAVAVDAQLQEDWVHILAEEYVADNFDSASYSGNDGSVNWTGDWVEIGENDGVSSGDVRIEDGRLYIQTAYAYEDIRGISRTVDLSQAATAYLSFYLDDAWSGTQGVVSIEVRTDSSADWVTLDAHEIVFLSDAQQMRYDISDYATATTEIRFISAGTNSGGLSLTSGDVYIDNLRIDYTTDSWSSVLWISTEGDVTGGGQDNVDTWQSSDLIGLDSSLPSLGTATDGEFSLTAQLSAFADGANIDGLHYVTTKMFIGDSGFQLEKGDILFVSSDATASSFGGIEASANDIILFRPTTEGDYSSGTFSILFDDLTTRNVTGITLVESGVTIGDRDLAAGDLLFISNDNKIYHFATTDVAITGTTSGAESILLDGDDADVSIATQFKAIDLIERTVTVGSTELEQGTLLLSTAGSGSYVGGDTVYVEANDIFALTVSTTSSADASVADLGSSTASYFFDGSELSFDTPEETIDAFSLTVQGEITGPLFTGAYFDADAMTITLYGENLDYLGEIGENVKDRIDWSKIIWDVNGDGDTTENIIFDFQSVSTVLTSESTLVIHLTGDKTSEITSTDGYGVDGGMDTITILPGFSSNEAGEIATTDGLSGATIYTETGPSGVNLSNASIEENIDTTGGELVGTLSTVDLDGAESFTYTITGGADAAYFRIEGDQLFIDAGVLDFETKSSYTVTLTVTEESGQTATETHVIMVTNINETPVLVNNNLTISEDGTVTLTTSNLSATDPESADGTLIFTVTSVSGGYFLHADTGQVTSFTQSDVSLGKISFVDNGDEIAPAYTITVSDDLQTSPESGAVISFTNVNDAAEIVTNSLTLSEGERVTVTSSDLVISDPDTDPSELVFTVQSVTGGQFELAGAPGVAISSFTLLQINNNEVEYVHNGGETVPAYTLSLDDKGIFIGPSEALITYTAVNDAPTIQSNLIRIDQNSSVTLTPAHLLATDPDDIPTDLVYEISSLSNGYFQVDGITSTSFTQDDINTGKVVFFHGGGAFAPSFDIEVSDSLDASSGIVAANIVYNAVNQPPTFDFANLTVSEGETATLSPADFSVTDIDNGDTSLIYTITSYSGGYFELATNPGAAITSFTQQNINDGDIQFVHDGGELAPAFTATVSDGEFTVSPASSNVYFTNVNDAPVIISNNLTITEGGEVTLTGANFSASDADDLSATLTFTVSEVIGGNFYIQNTSTPIVAFTKAQVDAGDIVFIHDGAEAAPSFKTTVSDGELSSSTQSATIVYAPANDTPVLVNNSFTVTEGQSVVLDATDISATDIDSIDSHLIFTVDDVEGGHFARAATPSVAIDSFTQAEIYEGDIAFVHNGSETTPTYTITVEDDGSPVGVSATASGTVTLIPVNDIPDLEVNTLTISEGQTLQVTTTMIAATDEDSVMADLSYTVSDLIGGIFVHSDAMDTPITSFSQTDLESGKIYIIHDGSETPLEYSISVSDGIESTTPSPASINFVPVNDAPLIINSSATEIYTEDTPRTLTGLSIEDPDGSMTYTVTLELSDPAAGTLSAQSTGTANSSFSGGVLTITGSDIDDVNTLLADISFTPTSDFTGTVTIAINANDGIDVASESTKTLFGIAINDAPEIVSNSFTVVEGATATITASDISATDIDSDDANLIFSINDEIGGYFAYSSAPDTVINSFSQTEISNGDVIFVHDGSETIPTYTITVSDDGTPVQSTGPQSGTATLIPVNDTPQATPLNQSGIYIEDVPYNFDNIIVSDPDKNEIITATLTLGAPSSGSLTTSGGAQYNNATGVWTITGSVASVNNALASVSFTPAANSFDDASISVVIEDGKEDGVSELTGTLTLTGTSAGDAPVVSDAATAPLTPTELLFITKNGADGDEVTHFRISGITGGELTLADGITVVADGDFITVEQGLEGLIFIPDSDTDGTFTVAASEDGTTVPTASVATTATIIVESTESPVSEGGSSSAEPQSSDDDVVETVTETTEEPTEETLLDQISVLDTETLQTATAEEMNEASGENSPDQNTDPAEEENQDENETEEETGTDDNRTYLNADALSDAPDDNGIEIFANFDMLGTDISFANTTIQSVSLSGNTTTTLQETASQDHSSEDAIEQGAFKTTDYSLIDLEYRDRSFEEYQSVRQSLETFREEAEGENAAEKTVIGSAIAASTGLSAGYVIWLLRSGALLSSILSSIPAWQLTDPLAVLAGSKDEADDDDDSLESIIEKGAEQSVRKEGRKNSDSTVQQVDE